MHFDMPSAPYTDGKLIEINIKKSQFTKKTVEKVLESNWKQANGNYAKGQTDIQVIFSNDKHQTNNKQESSDDEKNNVHDDLANGLDKSLCSFFAKADKSQPIAHSSGRPIILKHGRDVFIRSKTKSKRYLSYDGSNIKNNLALCDSLSDLLSGDLSTHLSVCHGFDRLREKRRISCSEQRQEMNSGRFVYLNDSLEARSCMQELQIIHKQLNLDNFDKLKLLIEQVIKNKCEDDLKELMDDEFDTFEIDEKNDDLDSKSDKYATLSYIDEVMTHKRHEMMGCPLTKAELFALILYTSCEKTQSSLTKIQIENVSKKQHDPKWDILDLLLLTAISKLSKYQCFKNFSVYSGACDISFDFDKYKENNCGKYPIGLATYTSFTGDKNEAKTFCGDTGMMVGVKLTSDMTGICDVEWVSKYPQEKEILFCRGLRFYATLVQEKNENDSQLQLVAFDKSNDDTLKQSNIDQMFTNFDV